METTTKLIKDSVRRLYEAQLKKKQTDQFVNDVKKKEQVAISNYMFSNLPKGQETFDIVLDEGETFYTNHVKLKVTRVRTKKVVWNIDKLKKCLNKTMFKNVVNKTYTINDMDGLISYLKECGVNPKKFKQFIDVTEVVDEKKFDYYYDLGQIKKSDVNGCYEIKFGEPYIRLTEQK